MRIQWKKTWAALSISAVLLSSCHTTMYNAAKTGDVETVRREIAAGADINESAGSENLWWQIPTCLLTVPLDVSLALTTGILTNNSNALKHYLLTPKVLRFGSTSPAEIAWEHNQHGVLNELALAGGGIAPASVAGKTIVCTPIRKANRYLDVTEVDCEPGENDLGFVSKNWPSDITFSRTNSSNTTTLTWSTSNVHQSRSKEKTGGISTEFLAYDRIAVDTAVIRQRSTLQIINGGRVFAKKSQMELYFETPNSGTFSSIEREGNAPGMIMSIGRFELR